MSVVAPEGLELLWHYIDKLIPAAQLSGIVGDINHVYGYHLSRDVLPDGDYSVQLPQDKKGPGDAASALDVTLPGYWMKVCTKRLVDAAKAGDVRIASLREFCGTLDGNNTYPWQVRPSSHSEGVGSWDDSHLWHIHFSVLRMYCDDFNHMRGVAEVMAGLKPNKAVVKPVKPPVLTRKYPLSVRDVFGPISDPSNRVHGGINATEKSEVKFLQTWFIAHGYVSGIKVGTPQARAWADGIWGPETTQACKKFYRRNYNKSQGVLGRWGYLRIVNGKALSA